MKFFYNYILEQTLFGSVFQIYMSRERFSIVTFHRKNEFEVEYIYMIKLCLKDSLIFIYSGLGIKQLDICKICLLSKLRVY